MTKMLLAEDEEEGTTGGKPTSEEANKKMAEILVIFNKRVNDPDKARLLRTALRNKIHEEFPEMRQRKNDDKKVDMMYAIVTNDSKLEKFLKEIEPEIRYT